MTTVPAIECSVCQTLNPSSSVRCRTCGKDLNQSDKKLLTSPDNIAVESIHSFPSYIVQTSSNEGKGRSIIRTILVILVAAGLVYSIYAWVKTKKDTLPKKEVVSRQLDLETEAVLFADELRSGNKNIINAQITPDQTLYLAVRNTGANQTAFADYYCRQAQTNEHLHIARVIVIDIATAYFSATRVSGKELARAMCR